MGGHRSIEWVIAHHTQELDYHPQVLLTEGPKMDNYAENLQIPCADRTAYFAGAYFLQNLDEAMPEQRADPPPVVLVGVARPVLQSRRAHVRLVRLRERDLLGAGLELREPLLAGAQRRRLRREASFPLPRPAAELEIELP